MSQANIQVSAAPAPAAGRTIHIPQLEHSCGSWIVLSNETGAAVAEFFNRSTVERVNPDKYTVVTALQYLGSLNS
jgi:hypothetical protein